MNPKNWGLIPPTSSDTKTYDVEWVTDPIPWEEFSASVLPHGQGRSYGDSCLNNGGVLLETHSLDHLIDFNEESGVLECESGITFSQILKIIVPRGWFLPVTPGTQFVSIGGAVANDIHGKNHHRSCTLGRHIKALELVRSDGSRRICSPQENTEFFSATIGGLGLTGLMTRVAFQLKRIFGKMLDVETIPFSGIEDFFHLAGESDKHWEYTVAWLDLSRPKRIKGIFFRGEHSRDDGVSSRNIRSYSVPGWCPPLARISWVVKYFNDLYAATHQASKKRIDYKPFFYPLDRILHWNRLYGRQGFFQYQCVVPMGEEGARPLHTLLTAIADSGEISPLVVTKVFGSLVSPGFLSFPREGVTLSLDFSHRGKETLDLFERLDSIVRECGGSVYPAKDARMSPETFQRSFPQWNEFTRYIDPKFSSSFWRRVEIGRASCRERV